eukprot:gene52953-64686_t
MKLHHLRNLVAVADASSIRGAARAQGLAQPAITRGLRDLEKELGVPLLERHGKGVSLNAYGQSFVVRARSILQDLERGRQEIEQLQTAVGGEEDSTEADIFETHLLILQDASILKQVEKSVREKLVRVDAVYYRLMCKNMDALRRLPDPYLRERYMDIKDVTQRVMRHLRGEMLDHP